MNEELAKTLSPAERLNTDFKVKTQIYRLVWSVQKTG